MDTFVNLLGCYFIIAILLSIFTQSFSTGISSAFLISIYMFPGYISGSRGHPNQDAICAMNLLLGWTIIGWIAAMIWALTDFDEKKRKPTITDLFNR